MTFDHVINSIRFCIPGNDGRIVNPPLEYFVQLGEIINRSTNEVCKHTWSRLPRGASNRRKVPSKGKFRFALCACVFSSCDFRLGLASCLTLRCVPADHSKGKKQPPSGGVASTDVVDAAMAAAGVTVPGSVRPLCWDARLNFLEQVSSSDRSSAGGDYLRPLATYQVRCGTVYSFCCSVVAFEQ